MPEIPFSPRQTNPNLFAFIDFERLYIDFYRLLNKILVFKALARLWN